MSSKDQWLLPDGIGEVLPPESWRLESARRELLDMFACRGYDLIMPPLIEYLESLLTGTGNDLDLQTFKVTDQMSGRMLGLRADMTPQAARIDAHPLQRDAPTRLCYMGSVLRTRNDGFGGSRSPLQVGAELFGHAGIESDVEILELVLDTLSLLEIPDAHIDLGHVGIFRALARDAGLSAIQENDLFEALQRKAIPEIEGLVESFGIEEKHARMLSSLARLNGDSEVIAQAREALSEAEDEVREAIDYVEHVANLLHDCLPDVSVHFDLAELRAYHYQTGVVFAAFIADSGNEIARGGRYDHIGEKFGRARPATGFSADLKTLMRYGSCPADKPAERIMAPWSTDAALNEEIGRLRAAGKVVIRSLSDQTDDAIAMGCSQELVLQDAKWILKAS